MSESGSSCLMNAASATGWFTSATAPGREPAATLPGLSYPVASSGLADVCLELVASQELQRGRRKPSRVPHPVTPKPAGCELSTSSVVTEDLPPSGARRLGDDADDAAGDQAASRDRAPRDGSRAGWRQMDVASAPAQRRRHPLTGGGGGDCALSAAVNPTDPANCLASWVPSRSPVGKGILATCRRRAAMSNTACEATATVLPKRLPLSISWVPIRATCPKTLARPAYTRRR